ncbi:cellobiose phosphorylase [Endozoicomonas sp. NE40]|uniref:Cellobiose phosphorylase n=1 Tax=Endozoicomonas lisbonensis TaxID=3120522 RepID=A0ABV2SL90_9GAMM
MQRGISQKSYRLKLTAVAFSADGTQFFGKSYKFTNQPEALIKPTLDNVKYQYEMAYVALQTADITLKDGDASSTVFYLYFKPHMEKSNVSEAEAPENIAVHYEAPAKDKAVAIAAPEFHLSGQSVLAGTPLSSDEVTEFFGTERRFVEEKNGVLLSFFHGDSQYVTLQEKELYLERSTGHMISSGNNQDFTNAVLSSTHGMYGVFNSHLVLVSTNCWV